MPGRKKIACALLLVAAALNAQEGGDVQAQILYAYCTEDINNLISLTQTLRASLEAATDNAAVRYHLAHAQYRLGQLAVGAASSQAVPAFSGCIDDLKPLLKRNVKSAEALILQGACYSALADVGGMQSVLLRSRAADRLQAAAAIEPRNPRLLLIEAVQGLASAKPGSSERRQASTRLEMAAAEFEASSATRIETPGWGDAQAYLMMGRELQSRGDTVGARNWMEKSLLAAPDYRAAQRQLASLEKR